MLVIKTNIKVKKQDNTNRVKKLEEKICFSTISPSSLDDIFWSIAVFNPKEKITEKKLQVIFNDFDSYIISLDFYNCSKEKKLEEKDKDSLENCSSRMLMVLSNGDIYEVNILS